MRPPPSPPPRHRLPRALAVLGSLLLFPALFPAVPTARADDTVRRAQEELRKRNLYFGDIDGVANRGTVGALKRYQERKRLAVTGEVDGETMRSLGIPSPHSESATAPIEPDPWPDIPVLRSDQARRPPPLAGEVVIAEPAPDAAVNWNAQGSGPAPLNAEPSPAGVIGEATETAPAPLTPAAARSYLESYLRDGSLNDLRVEMAHYADVVDYFNKGPAIRDYIRRDVSAYYKRWPERHYEILGPVNVSPGPRPGETVLRFQIHYRCRGPGHEANGRTENVFTVQTIQPCEVRIVAMKEQRVR